MSPALARRAGRPRVVSGERLADWLKREPTPADWGATVTVCIAAACDGGRTLVSVSDRMVSLGMTSADSVTVKGYRIHEMWAAMFSGNNVTVVNALTRFVVSALRGLAGTIDDVKNAFRAAYKAEFVREVEINVLGHAQMTIEEFIREGRKYFGDTEYIRLFQEVEQVDLGCTFLVHGFDSAGTHILTVGGRGAVKEYGPLGFWAIGSGDNAALSSLFFNGYNGGLPLEEAVYRLCEAKFMAEGAAGVGADTVLAILKSDKTAAFLHGAMLDPIRVAWDTDGKPRVPKGLDATVKAVLSGHIGPIGTFAG